MSEPRDRYVITFEPRRGVDGIRALHRVLKMAGRYFGLRAIDAYEDRSSSLEISNRVADEFKKAPRRGCRGASSSNGIPF